MIPPTLSSDESHDRCDKCNKPLNDMKNKNEPLRKFGRDPVKYEWLDENTITFTGTDSYCKMMTCTMELRWYDPIGSSLDDLYETKPVLQQKWVDLNSDYFEWRDVEFVRE